MTTAPKLTPTHWVMVLTKPRPHVSKGANISMPATARNDSWNPGAITARGSNSRISTAAAHNEFIGL